MSQSDSDFDAVRLAMKTKQIPEDEISQGSDKCSRALGAFEIGDRQMVWRAARLDDCVIKFDELLGERTYWPSSVGYAVCYIHSVNEQRDLQMKVGWSDFAKIYLNGKGRIRVWRERIHDRRSHSNWHSPRTGQEHFAAEGGQRYRRLARFDSVH